MRRNPLTPIAILLFSLLIFSCSSSDNGPSETETETQTEGPFAMMTGNIAGVQYNAMQPVFYMGTNSTRVVTYVDSPENFLGIQGNSSPMNPYGGDSKEINIFIPESQWAVGTYVLSDSPFYDSNPQSHVNIIYNDSSLPTSQAFEEEDGSITITKFDRQSKIVEGTFQFRFKLSFVGSGTYSDLMEVRNGTFKYSLDAEYFD